MMSSLQLSEKFIQLNKIITICLIPLTIFAEMGRIILRIITTSWPRMEEMEVERASYTSKFQWFWSESTRNKCLK